MKEVVNDSFDQAFAKQAEKIASQQQKGMKYVLQSLFVQKWTLRKVVRAQSSIQDVTTGNVLWCLTAGMWVLLRGADRITVYRVWNRKDKQ